MRRNKTKETKVQNVSRRKMQSAEGSFRATPHLAQSSCGVQERPASVVRATLEVTAVHPSVKIPSLTTAKRQAGSRGMCLLG